MRLQADVSQRFTRRFEHSLPTERPPLGLLQGVLPASTTCRDTEWPYRPESGHGSGSHALEKTGSPPAGQASCTYTFDQWLNAPKAPTVGRCAFWERRDKEHAGAGLIAIVDDEAPLCEATGSLLKSVGYRVLTFASAEQFLLSPLRRKVRALVLDVDLPGMTGLQLQQHLVAEGDCLPIIFITAQDDVQGRHYRQAMESGALTVLGKPFDDDDLLRILAPVMQGRQSSPDERHKAGS